MTLNIHYLTSGILSLKVRLEEICSILLRNSNTLVRNFYSKIVNLIFLIDIDCNLNHTIFLTEFNRILDQIDQNLLNPHLVYVKLKILIDFVLNLNA